MTYLIVKFLLLLLLATLFGFLLGRWWVRRQFVDVSESYEGFKRSAEAADSAPWGDLFSRFDGLEPAMRKSVRSELDAQPAIEFPTVDLSGIDAKLRQVDARFNDIPVPEPVDLSATHQQIAALKESIDAIPVPKAVDLSATNDKVRALEEAIRAMPLPKDPEPVDLAPVNDRLNELAASVRAFPQQIPQAKPVDLASLDSKFNAISAMVGAIEIPAPAADVDLAPLESKLASLESSISNLPKPSPAQHVDLEPTNRRIGAIETAVRGIPKAPELQPVEQRLASIEERLKLLIDAQKKAAQAPAIQPLAAVSAPASPPVAKPASKEPRLLKTASFGTKDDLKRISGVGPMLEDLLNKHGVYYFWQVADWTPSDVQVMDERLEVFKGRIERDEWVTQSKLLAAQPGTANKPKDEA